MSRFLGAALSIALIVLPPASAQQNNRAQPRNTDTAAAIRLTRKETEARLVSCSPAQLDGRYCGKGVSLVRVLIAPDGSVSRATALTGGADMKRIAAAAVADWRFVPYEIDGQPVAVLGLVMVRVSWDRRYGRDSCEASGACVSPRPNERGVGTL